MGRPPAGTSCSVRTAGISLPVVVLIACDLLDGLPMPFDRAGNIIRIGAVGGGTFAQGCPFDPATNTVLGAEHRE
ncbi:MULTISPECIES: hypothetical protein [unclassified Bradyrhizobium]|uniref:hypothetical protein n=1 Tax=unclassified Bradyrhizobium TaxID=2631580 RepID=UPI001FFF66CB|nr:MULTISPECIES: hypothetical protein [unclassified Bradyrhizobium]UPK17569.1 hypothetical protein IVA73_26255 [Bradyrhizobium sp. 131]